MNDIIEKLSEAPKIEAAVVELSSETSSGDNEAALVTEVSPVETKSPKPVQIVEGILLATPASCDENAKEDTAANDVVITNLQEETNTAVEEPSVVHTESPKSEESIENPIPTPPSINKTEDTIPVSEPVNVTEIKKLVVEIAEFEQIQISTKTNGDHGESLEKEVEKDLISEVTKPQEIEALPKYITALKDIDISVTEISPLTVAKTTILVEETPIITEEPLSENKKSSLEEKPGTIAEETLTSEEIEKDNNIEKVPSPEETSPVLDVALTPKDINTTPMDILVKTIDKVPQKNQISPPPKQALLSEEIETFKIEIKPAIEILSTPKEIEEVKSQPVVDDKTIEKAMDVEMTEAPLIAPVVIKHSETEPVKTDPHLSSKHVPDPTVNGDTSKDEKPAKRRASEDVDSESPLKKLFLEVEKNFPTHDLMINDYIQTATKNNVDEIQRHTEQLLSEIQTLRTLAQKKEHEWNNILHLKKVKEEILLRLLRRKQVLSFEKAAEQNGADRTDPYDYLHPSKSLAIDKSDEISGLAIKQPSSNSIMSPIIQAPMMPVTSQCHFNPMSGLPPPYDKPHLQSMPKYPQTLMMPGPMPIYPRDMNGQLPTSFGLPIGRQGPTKDVKSIIADYRQRNPDITPRRGRRMKSALNTNMMNPRPIAPKMDPMNSLNSLNNLNMLFNNLDMNQKAMLERLQQMQAGNMANGLSFKDVLVQYANMQQGAGLMPNRPMETISRPEHHSRPDRRPSRQERSHEDVHIQSKPQAESSRMASPNPRLPPPPPYPEISLLPVTTATETTTSVSQQNSLLHGILTKPPQQALSPTLARLLTSADTKQQALPSFGQAKNCGEITITPVQPTPPPEPPHEKPEEVVQLDDEESPASETSGAASPAECSGRLVIDEGGGGEGGAAEGGGGEGGGAEGAPLCQGCRRRDAQFVCAGCANQWYCSRDCQVAAWDDHSEMCSG